MTAGIASFRSRAAALVLALMLSGWPAVQLAGAVELDAPAPALRGTLLSGAPFDLAAMRGHVVLVNFFSSWCRICALEIGSVETFRDDHAHDGLIVLMIAVDRPDDTARVARMLGIYNLDGAMTDALDTNGFERRYLTPTAFVVDRDGMVRAKHVGAKTLPTLRALLGPLLAPADPPR